MFRWNVTIRPIKYLKTRSLNDLSQNLVNLSRVLNPQKSVLIERRLKS